MLGWHLKWITDETAFLEATGPKVSYSTKRLGDSFHIIPSGYLASGATLPDEETHWKGHTVLYPVKGDLPFDLFAFAFFLLSRSEEYDGPRDEHGRFPSDQAWVVKHGKQLAPILDEVILDIAKGLRKKWPDLPAPRRSYAHTVTFDIDNGLKFAGRELWRTFGSLVRDLIQLRVSEVKNRLAVLLNDKPDPYELEELMQWNAGSACRVITFFLASERGKYDHAVDIEHPRMLEKLISMTEWSEIAIHPSYHSMEEPARIKAETSRLSEVVDQPVVVSRQHFLKFKLPGTYRSLISAGIGEDHSMGFSDRVGFRAGTCTAFPWYDLQAEQETTLMIHPFAAMDSALCYKMRLSRKEAIAMNQLLIAKVRNVQGQFESVWHERFLAGTGNEKGWDTVFKETMSWAKEG